MIAQESAQVVEGARGQKGFARHHDFEGYYARLLVLLERLEISVWVGLNPLVTATGTFRGRERAARQSGRRAPKFKKGVQGTLPAETFWGIRLGICAQSTVRGLRRSTMLRLEEKAVLGWNNQRGCSVGSYTA